MFGPRTIVKKVRNSLTWFSHLRDFPSLRGLFFLHCWACTCWCPLSFLARHHLGRFLIGLNFFHLKEAIYPARHHLGCVQDLIVLFNSFLQHTLCPWLFSTQWFGSCSLMSTLYVWFPASWVVAESLYSWSSPPRGSSYPQHGLPASGPPQTHSGAHPWHQHSHGAAGSSGAMEDTDSTEVMYKIRQWSLPGAAIVPVLNVSSRVFWLELRW